MVKGLWNYWRQAGRDTGGQEEEEWAGSSHCFSFPVLSLGLVRGFGGSCVKCLGIVLRRAAAFEVYHSFIHPSA